MKGRSSEGILYQSRSCCRVLSSEGEERMVYIRCWHFWWYQVLEEALGVKGPTVDLDRMGEPSIPKRVWGGRSLRSWGSWWAGDPRWNKSSYPRGRGRGTASDERGGACGEWEGQEQGPGGWGGSCPLQRGPENPGGHVGHCTVGGSAGLCFLE